MSRIDEALKRAAQLELDSQGGAVAELVAPAANAAILERYAAEAPPRPSGDFPPEVVIRPISAPVGPVAPARKAHPSSPKLVGGADVAPATVDQFRRLGAVLHDTQMQTGLKVLMVSSAVPGDGKTFTIVNLALTFSESFQRRVLLIDGDLRRPTIHDVLGCSNESGLADVLRTDNVPLPLVEVSSRLTVLTAGRPTKSPLAQLTSERIRKLIDNAATQFDWVLIDTPPVALLPDAQLVARMTEGVLFVIAAGSTPFELVNRSIAELGPERIVGTVLNRVEPRSLRTSDYAGYY